MRPLISFVRTAVGRLWSEDWPSAAKVIAHTRPGSRSATNNCLRNLTINHQRQKLKWQPASQNPEILFAGELTKCSLWPSQAELVDENQSNRFAVRIEL